jgi:uncharacterized membrane protein YdjX (TVP38/TMEM64 family)/rhodanese-related sulfurtransferase
MQILGNDPPLNKTSFNRFLGIQHVPIFVMYDRRFSDFATKRQYHGTNTMTRQRILRLTLIAVLAIGITLAIDYRDQFDPTALEQWLQQFGLGAPLLFMFIYILATVFFFPGSLLTLAGGALFGPLWGTLYNLTAATIGAGLAFLVARYIASDWVSQKSGGRLKQIMAGVDSEGWRFVAFVRLVPLFPFNLLNYALGLTRIRFTHYLIASYICMLPGALAYTYLGFAGREAVAGGEGLIQKGLLALALLAMVAFLPRLIQKMRGSSHVTIEQLRERIEKGEQLLILDIRSDEEYQSEKELVASAIHIPVDEVAIRLFRIESHRDRPIAIIGNTPEELLQTEKLLKQLGFTQAFKVDGEIETTN